MQKGERFSAGIQAGHESGSGADRSQDGLDGRLELGE